MRTINATLKAAMAKYSGQPVVRFYQQALNGSDQHIYNVIGYELKGLDLHVRVKATDFVAPSSLTGYLTRGLLINGVEYLMPTNYYAIIDIELNDSFAIFHCNILNNLPINQAADVIVSSLLTTLKVLHFQSLTPIYNTDYTEAWTGYKYENTGVSLALANSRLLVNSLKQKYCCYISAHNDVSAGASTQEIKFFSTYWRTYNLAINSYPTVKNISSLVNLNLNQFNFERCSWIWTDENKTKHRTNGSTYHLHNLGFMPSTATWPSPTNISLYLNKFDFLIYPDFELQDGDNLNITMLGQTFKSMIKIAERFNWTANQIPWHMELSQIDIY